MLATRTFNLKGRLDQAISRLMAVSMDGEGARLSVPVLYPSGTGGAVEVVVSGDRCFVSDLGLGHLEAEMQGADSFYDGCARLAAERFSVGYDGLSIFASWASISKIESAVTLVANASVNAASAAIFKAMEETVKQQNHEVYDRVVSIFGQEAVTREMDLPGRDATWPAHNVVALPEGRKAIFEFVRDNQNSIANKFMMYSDLSRREGVYSLNSVVRSIEKIGNKGAMLADISNVIELNANPTEFVRYARAA